MSNSRICFPTPITKSGLRGFLDSCSPRLMDEEILLAPQSSDPSLSLPKTGASILPSSEVVSRCNHLSSMILTSPDPTARARWLHELLTLTLSLSTQLTTAKNALNTEVARSVDMRSTNCRLEKHLTAVEEALEKTVSMLTVQAAVTASARASIREKDAEINEKNMEVEKMKESTKQSTNANFANNGKKVPKVNGIGGGIEDRNRDETGVPAGSDEKIGNEFTWGSKSNPDSLSAHIAALEKELKAEKGRTAGFRKLLNSALDECGLLQTSLAEATYSGRSPLAEIPSYKEEELRTPTGREKQRLQTLREANDIKSQRHHKKRAPRQRAEWIFGKEAARELPVTAEEIDDSGPFVITSGEDGTTLSSKNGGDPFSEENRSKRYMTFPPEVAPMSYRPGAGSRRGNAIYAL
ncbi:hypothetical protein L873DRAFT_402823 [Choiromyces venosus 120613-1]|uniref:Uncharacterized protein n=1 Tax=Choiromyces venosus 120613-1 TaxID=1336337 RepID=A0A3N4J203_9PEZI|nr:hypothetical protein L873DRAFT_402823 [Choiromyces venosus 120613-1]